MKKKNAVFEDIITTVSRYFVVLVVIVIVCIGFSGIRFVKSGEVAIVLRFGKLVGNTPEEQIHEPGILFAFPYIIDEVVTVKTGSVMERTVTTHFTEGSMTTINNNGYVVTGDNNIALMKVSVKYTITDPVNYALKIKDIDSIIDACVSNAMLERAACTKFDAILTSGKEKFSTEVRNVAQQSLDNNNVGVTLSTVELTNVAPPEEVKSVYELVNAATVDAEKILKEANQYKEQTLIAASASAEKIISSANTTYSQKTSAANSDLAEFWGTRDEYERSPASRIVVRERIKSDKLSTAIAKIGKVVAVKDGNSHIIIN